MSETIYEVRRALRLVNPKSLLNAATGAAEGLLRRTTPRCLPTSLDIVLTKACNLRCIFCISYDSLDNVHWMDFDVYKRIARELFPTTLGIFICSGGEPLLYPHLREALQLARQHRTMATMTSNGMLLNQDVARWMVADQSLQELCISFDGARKETLERIRRGANYEQILQNIDYLARCKADKHAEFPRLWFRFAIMRSNAQELPEMLRLCKEHGLYKVEVKYLNVANDIPFDESLYNHPQLAQEVFAEARAKAAEYGVDVKLPPPARQSAQALQMRQTLGIRPDRHRRLHPHLLLLLETAARTRTGWLCFGLARSSLSKNPCHPGLGFALLSLLQTLRCPAGPRKPERT